MKSPRLGHATAAIVAALALTGCTGFHTSKEKVTMTTDRKTQVVALLKAIETGESAPVAIINPDHYVQHNLAVADGLAGFGAALAALPAGSARVNTVRVFEDGDYVFAHTD
ncbi:MAG: hypothetical protein Q8M64_16190, partial [Methyloversatilis sp.]|nr:hypothetical protein [Methyloversatilis sp.]